MMPWLATVLAITLVACGAPRPPAEDPDDDDDRGGVFVDPEGFEPTSFQVKVTGEGGRPIIFIPGLGCPGEAWDETVELLGEDYEAHVLTLAGFAGTKPIETPLSSTVRRELTRYIRSLRMVKPIIVGHSMGGFIAFWLAANFPENTGPVIIVDSGPAISGDLESAQRFRERWANASDEAFERQARVMYRGMARNKAKLEPYARQAARSDRRSLGDAIYEMMITNLTSRMGEIRSPVLVVLADGYFKTRITRQVQGIRDKKIVVFKTGHFVMLDDPEGFIDSVTEFLEDHPAPDD